MQLSQGHLNSLDYCPRRFQHTYLDQLAVPLTPAQQGAIALGNRFHTLMQQRELGLVLQPFDPDSESEPEDRVYQDLERFLAAAPEVLRRDRVQFRQSEHRRYLQFQGFFLTVIYDLLILETDRAEILDWKTQLLLPSDQALAKNWQLKLYPYVLAASSSYPPDQIHMTYWFVRSPTPAGSPTHSDVAIAPTNAEAPTPTALRFPYTGDRHHQIQAELTQRLTQLQGYLQNYETGGALPQIDEALGKCYTCPFAIRCRRTASLNPPEVNLPGLAEIQEIVI